MVCLKYIFSNEVLHWLRIEWKKMIIWSVPVNFLFFLSNDISSGLYFFRTNIREVSLSIEHGPLRALTLAEVIFSILLTTKRLRTLIVTLENSVNDMMHICWKADVINRYDKIRLRTPTKSRHRFLFFTVTLTSLVAIWRNSFYEQNYSELTNNILYLKIMACNFRPQSVSLAYETAESIVEKLKSDPAR